MSAARGLRDGAGSERREAEGGVVGGGGRRRARAATSILRYVGHRDVKCGPPSALWMPIEASPFVMAAYRLVSGGMHRPPGSVTGVSGASGGGDGGNGNAEHCQVGSDGHDVRHCE